MQASIPPSHQVVMPYLIVSNAEVFISFLKDVFKAKELNRHLRPGEESKIMHAELSIGNCTIMLADSMEQFGPQPAGLFVYVDDADATYNLALTKGATSIMPPADQTYGRSGGITDPFGNVWWITSI